MPRRAYHEPACCCGGCDPAPAPPPCYYPAPVPVPAPCYYPTPSSSASDHLLHAIAAHLLLGSSTPAPPPQPQPPPAAPHATNPYPYPPHHYQYQQQEAKPHPPPQHQPQPSASDHGHLLLHSLLRRVAALESALPRCSPHPPLARRRTIHPNPRPRRVAHPAVEEDDGDDFQEEEEEAEDSQPSPPRRLLQRRAGPSSSARDLAARTIQAHFRRFLARRSRTLRQLKELAVLRSQSASLRGSLSGRRGRGADPEAVSEAAMGLLFRLDAIQGGDPMIREGKRAVSRELTRILEFVDKVLVKEHEQLAMPMAAAALEDNDDYSYHGGCSAEFAPNRPTLNKKVSFSSNGRIHELINGEAQNRKEVDEGSDESESSAGSDEVKPGKRSANGNKPGLAAPMPVHMETRRVDGERR